MSTLGQYRPPRRCHNQVAMLERHKPQTEATMGLLDILNGMRNGPQGQTNPSKSGMSPIAMAILGLLAAKAIGKLTGPSTAAPAPAPTPSPGARPSLPDLGNLGNLLPGDLGKMLGPLTGANPSSALTSGLNDLLKRFQDTGLGDTAKTWVSTGPNKDISESDLAKSIGIDDINALVQHTGVPRDTLLTDLRQELPDAIDKVTPDGRVPDADELTRHLDRLGSGASGGER